MCTIRGQGRRLGLVVGCMFPMDNLCLPPIALVFVATTVAVVSSIHSLAFWHSHLGHAPSFQVQQLASRGIIGFVSKDKFHYTSCQ